MREMRKERVTVTMPADDAAAVRRFVDAGGAESVSAYVAEAVRGRLARDRALLTLNELYAQRGVRLDPEHHAWAREVLGVAPARGPVS
jgi:Arc/MetJ-type ribon-helix-helix transcriptional regulator